MESLTDYVKPELFILIPVLYAIGVWIKSIKKLDCFIPLILSVCGIMLSFLYVCSAFPMGSVRDLLAAVFTSITQGILCAALSVYANQIFKQKQKLKDEPADKDNDG